MCGGEFLRARRKAQGVGGISVAKLCTYPNPAGFPVWIATDGHHGLDGGGAAVPERPG